MSDPITKQAIILLKDKRPSSCFKDQIYDPDLDGPWTNDESFPRVVPLEGATVIERETGVLWYVKHVDPFTYKSTLGNTKIVVDVAGEEIRVISYGNDRYLLFVNKDHRPTQLTVSNNFIVFGSSLVEYQLYKRDRSGNREVISVYLDSDENYRGNRIPLMPISPGSAIKKCTNCHTLSELVLGESVEMDVFDNVGILSMTIRLFVVESVTLNDLASDSDMIIGMDVSALQMMPDGSLYLYKGQDPKHLGVIPRLIYSDGRYEDLPIDNKTCYMYGLEGFIPSFPGQKQKIILKKFLGPKQYSSAREASGGERYVTCETWVTVLPNKTMDGIKVSVMPIWNPTENNYYLKYIAYSDKRDRVEDVTTAVRLLAPIDTGKFAEKQNLRFEVDLAVIYGSDATIPYGQNNWMVFQNQKEYQRWTISDMVDMAVTYGVESTMRRRPVIHYDTTLGKYFIPTSRFRNKEALFDAFYFCANPPFNVVDELSAPEPTHFTIRGLDNLTTLIITPIPITAFNTLWAINRVGATDILVKSTVIVEFLKEQGNEYQILYGVPVDVYNSVTGWNSEPNIIT